MAVRLDPAVLGKIAVDLRLITQAQLDEALAVQACYGEEKSLAQVMLDLKYLTPEQIAQIEVRASAPAGRSPPPGPLPHGPPAAAPPARAAAPPPPPKRAQPPGPPPRAERSGSVPAPPSQKRGSSRPRGSHPSPRVSIPPAPGVPSVPPPEEAHASRPSLPPAPPVGQRSLDKMLAQAVKLKASDVHIHAGAQAQLRVNGKLFADKAPPLEAAKTEASIFEILTPEQRHRLIEDNDLDFVYAIPGVGRFRTNVYRQLRGFDAVFRFIPPEPPTLDELGLARTLAPLTKIQNGLVLLTGPAGCGKSSTMAALIDQINRERAAHVITIEDPIEFVHRSRKSLITQREIARHTGSFASALRAALRQHPDIIAIGELRDLETIALAVTAAETGHLVLGTLHTNNAVRSINRMLDVFPPKQQPQIRAMLSDSIRAVVSQRLLPSADGNRRIPVVELLLATHAVSNMIREEKTHQIRSVLQTAGRSIGMIGMDDALAELVKMGAITKEVARRHCDDPKVLG